ncbi:hypothetical protein PIB30_099161 [Stylosanthes scabra]|uniref:Uncharacterized protein n=1 Tax=Stylosanthes scabra TaxID=79078 RepID=A0ABU6V0K2_9FABA|nr:hypothetical protein [Stylosanthes scabra]
MLQFENLEIQVGQIAKQLAEKPPNTLPSNTIPNPREECKAIQVIEMEEIPEVQVEVSTEKPEIITETKNKEDVQHPPQSSKKHTRHGGRPRSTFNFGKTFSGHLKSSDRHGKW